jgi:LmbE family N-acetylglucosaminyl deacetylase
MRGDAVAGNPCSGGPAASLRAMGEPVLPALPDDAFSRVLCVVAHPDDVEYGTSSAVAAWTDRGVEVAYLLLTRGEAGMDVSPPERTAGLRTQEQITASQVVGVSDVTFLDHSDGVLVYGLPLRRDISRAIRSYRPDAVLIGSWEVETPIGFNQADHRVAGLAGLDAVRDAANRWVFPELLEEGLEPWSPRWLLITGDPRPTHGVDITGKPLERGIASLEAHGQYLAGIPGHPPPRMMITGVTALLGRRMGVPHAVLLRAVDLHAPPAILDEVRKLAAGEPTAGG